MTGAILRDIHVLVAQDVRHAELVYTDRLHASLPPTMNSTYTPVIVIQLVSTLRRMRDWRQVDDSLDCSNPPRVLHRARVLDRDLGPRCHQQVPLPVQPSSAFVQVDSFAPWGWVLWPWGHSPRPPGDPRAGQAAPRRKSLPRRWRWVWGVDWAEADELADEEGCGP